MACLAESKPIPSSFDKYGTVYTGKLKGNGKIDRFEGWSRFNATTLNDTRVGSFSSNKEDNANFTNLYNLHEEDYPNPPTNKSGRLLTKSRSTKAPIAPETKLKSVKSDPRSDRKQGPEPLPEETSTAPAPRIRHARSASFAPPYAGYPVKPSPSRPNVRTSPEAHGTQHSPESVTANSRRQAAEPATARATLHRRGSSDMAALRGAAADFFSSDSSLKLEPETTRRSSIGNDILEVKRKTTPVKERGGGSVSSRNSSVAGSPTVARTSSSVESASGGRSPTGEGMRHARSASCNVGNLLGAATSGAYSGGGLNSGSSVSPLQSHKTIPTTAPPTGGKMLFGGGLMNGGGSINTTPPKPTPKQQPQVDTPRVSTSDPFRRGNIHVAGESQLLKRMLSSCDPEEIKRAGNEQYKKGNFSEALTLYDRAVQLAPHKAPYRSNRAAALTGLNKLPEAVKECEEAIKLDPGYTRAHQRLGSLLLRLGRTTSAKKHVKLAGLQHSDGLELQRIEKVERHLGKCLEARMKADWETVVRESDAAVVAGADSAPQVFSLKAEAFLKQKKPEEADTVLLAAQKVEDGLRRVTSLPADTTTLLVQAQIDMALGRFEGAVIAAEKAAYYDPKNTEVSPALRQTRAVANARTQGNDLYKAGKILEASVAYSEGLQYNPSNAILLCNRAACRLKLGHYEKAVEDCTSALEAQPNYLKALLRRANCFVKMEKWEKAMRDYETLKKEMPGDLEIAKTLFQVQLSLKKAKGEKVVESQHDNVVEDISSADRLREAISQQGVSVVQFNTKWSDKCRQMSTYVNQLCKLHPSVNFLKVDVEENPYLAKAEGVSFVPTFKIYKNGFKVKDMVGSTQQALETAVSHFSL